MNNRDIKLRLSQQLNKKANEKPKFRSVICAADGSRTTGDMWADENNKIVWHQLFGSGGIGRAKCTIITPELGLGVEVSQIDSRLAEWEVVGPDPFLRRTATDNRNYQTIAPTDLQPGGRLMLWVDSRQIEPLATWDTAGTLQVNVTAGDYPYLGTRKSFVGQNGIDLAASVPGGGLTRYVGLYLDASNALQTVNGATTTIGLTPAEPSWPAGAFRLSVVQLDNGQTSIDFANDILDRRLAWSDEQATAGGGGWPFDNVKTVSATDANADYTTIALAIAGASASDVILLDAETYTVTATITVNKAVTIIGHPGGTIVTTSTNSLAVFTITTAGAQLRNMTITNSGAGTSPSGVLWNVNDVVLENLTVTKTGNPTINRGLWQYGGTGAKIINCDVTVSGASITNAAYYNDIATASAEIRGGKFSGTQYDIYSAEAGSTLVVNGVSLGSNIVSHAGTITLFGIKGAAFVAHKNGTDQTGIVTSTWTKLTFGTEVFDRNGDYDAGNSKHLPLIPGNYNYTAAALLVTPTDQASVFFAIYKNGTLLRADSRNASGTSNMSVSITAMVNMNGTTDYVEAYIWHNVGVNKTVSGSADFTYFQGNLVQ